MTKATIGPGVVASDTLGLLLHQIGEIAEKWRLGHRLVVHENSIVILHNVRFNSSKSWLELVSWQEP